MVASGRYSPPLKNSSGYRIIPGCNYHTTWQNHPAMQFVLDSLVGDTVILSTRTTGKLFRTPVDDLIFIDTLHNRQKAHRLTMKILVEAKSCRRGGGYNE